MNHHSAPPGDWHPPEPEWVNEARKLVEQANRISEKITQQVQQHVKNRRLDFLRWFLAGTGGVWVGMLSAELFKWLVLK